MEIKKRVGKIRISKSFLNNESHIKILSFLFKKFIPFRIEDDEYYPLGGKIYFGYSKLFEKINDGDLIPEYIVHFESKDYSPNEEIKYKIRVVKLRKYKDE